MMIRPAELTAIKQGAIDLAFRRWERPRVVVGTQMRTGVGLVEVVSVEPVEIDTLTEDDARRAGAESLASLLRSLDNRVERPAYRVGLRYAGPDPRIALREAVPDEEEIARIKERLARLDRSAPVPWTAEALDLIDRFPERRAPDLAAQVGRETADFKRDVRKLKELGLTESLDIGYRLSRRGEAVVDAGRRRPRRRTPRPTGTPLPRLGASATRALRAEGLLTLEAIAEVTEQRVGDLAGVGPIAIARLREALAEADLSFAAGD